MKKALSLIVAMCMIFSMAVMASAAGTPVTVDIVNDSGKMVELSGSWKYTDSGITDSGKAGTITNGTFSIEVVKGGELTVTANGNYEFKQADGSYVRKTTTVTVPANQGAVLQIIARAYTPDNNNNNGGSIVPNPTPSNKPSTGGSGGGGGGGGGSGSSKSASIHDKATSEINGILKKYLTGGTPGIGGGSNTTTTSNVTPATASKAATSAVNSAVQQAMATGADKARARVTFQNVNTLTTDVINAIAKAASAASKGMDVSVVVNADTVANGVVQARVSVDIALAVQNGAPINTTVDVNANSKTNKAVANHFKKYFKNDVVTAAFGQKGEFGQNVAVALKVDLSGMDVDNLVLYSYDISTNSFTQIETQYTIDQNGYVHFSTPVGGSVVISNGPLEAI